MCGRISVIDSPLADVVSNVLGICFSVPTNRDLRPTQQMETVIGGQRGPRQLSARWGIQPQWSKRLLINAQAETVAQKPIFRQAFNDRRCVVPCSGWYEWRDEGSSNKQRYLFEHAERQPLYMAAIWYPNLPGKERPQIVTLTTAPNARCAEYHQRMPVLILPPDVESWLNSRSDTLQPLMAAVDSELISVAAAT